MIDKKAGFFQETGFFIVYFLKLVLHSPAY
jgi:hypothetical protein